jgi:hypothetical protein
MVGSESNLLGQLGMPVLVKGPGPYISRAATCSDGSTPLVQWMHQQGL